MKYTLIYYMLISNLFGYNLTIQVDNFRNSKGLAQFSLYNTKGSIPDQHFTKYYKQIKTNIHHNTAKVVFTNLPEGKYAVNILHDENKNGKIDQGFILPTEGIGFTNFDSINLMNKPNFHKASILLNQDKIKNIKVIYF